jgi:hypothetical protein
VVAQVGDDDTQSGRQRVGAAEMRRLSAEIASHMTRHEWQVIGERVSQKYLAGRAVPEGSQAMSLAATEEHIAGLEAQIASLSLPSGLHPVDLYRRHEDLLKATATMNTAATRARTMLVGVRNEICDYLGRAERELLFGQVSADIWERNRQFVDERLATIAPDALEQFAAAYRRQAEGDAEARSHALTSCRRVLKTVADALYPATGNKVAGIDGAERKMTDDKFVSRLCQFVTEKAQGSNSQALVVSQVRELATRLDALNSLASKGVHASVSQHEVDHCLIQTYITVGDLLRIEAGTSAALVA